MLKMIPVKLMMLGCALILVPAANASAHSNEARQDEQADAIEQGRREGSITWREGRQLRKDQREIARVKETLEADGELSRNEKHVLFKMQDAADQRIEAEANDTWHRASWLPRFAR